LRNRRRIRDWLTNQLEEKLQLPSPWTKTESGQIVLKPGLDHARISNPVLLRCEALEGRLEKPEELHAAIAHLWKRRAPPPNFRPIHGYLSRQQSVNNCSW
jgi:hypothetical protein